jgi:hypothetical protein
MVSTVDRVEMESSERPRVYATNLLALANKALGSGDAACADRLTTRAAEYLDQSIHAGRQKHQASEAGHLKFAASETAT